MNNQCEKQAECRRYADGLTGGPLLQCPRCGTSLTAAGSLLVEQTDARGCFYEAGRLDESGVLAGVPGRHSGTYCEACWEPLDDLEVK